MSFGHDRERQVKKLLEEEGWFVIRAPASLGVADLVAVRRHPHREIVCSTVKFVEVKGNVGNPYMNFRPEDRQALLDAAEKAGARAELAFWPKRGNLTWIGSEAWPK